MKIIFLDFDGVMNCDHCFLEHGKQTSVRPVGYPHVVALRAILEATGAKIVVSSTWRIGFGVEAFNAVLKVFGLPGDPVVDITPRTGKHRGEDIRQWLAAQEEEPQFVILDDDGDMEPYMARLYKTDNRIGLLPTDIQAVCDLMEK